MRSNPDKSNVHSTSCGSGGKPESAKGGSCPATQHEDGKEGMLAATANRLVELCKAGHFDEAEDALYADDASSVEPFSCEGQCKTAVGKDAIKAKSAEWHKHMTVNHCEVEGPFLQPDCDRFAVVFKMDVTCDERGSMRIDEVALYTCDSNSGKIIRAEFFHAPPEGGECAGKNPEDKAVDADD